MNHPDANQDLSTYSQHGEDIFIWHLFQILGFKTFSYLDLGAHHPSIISNTKLFYDRGCRGVNVEANSHLFELFKKERPEDVTVNVGVGPEAGTKDFYVCDVMSPCNTFSKNHAVQINQTKQVPVLTLTQIVRDLCGGLWPDFINCDIEGLDYDVLSSYVNIPNFTSVICVEVSWEDVEKMTAMLKSKGYFPYARILSNVIYVSTVHKEHLMRGLGIS